MFENLVDDAAKHVDEMDKEAAVNDGFDPEAVEVVVEETSADASAEQIANLEQQLLRARADFDNFRRRTRQEKDELSQFATKKLLGDLLPVVDNFDRALMTVEPTADEQLKTGLEMVHRQLLQVLANYGVEPMQAEGEAFDPTRHEAVMQESAEGKDANVVLQELQKGYLLHDKVLRPAMVKVSV